MESAQWPQDIVTAANTTTTVSMVDQRKTRPQQPHKAAAMISCPRCNSGNTKFCYYNNYSLSQPRYFCKSCRRYWTEGGSLRNIPVGGGSRRKSTHKKPLNNSSKKNTEYNNNNNNNNNNSPNSIETLDRQQNPRSRDHCDFTAIDELIRVPSYGPSSGLEPNIANATPGMAPLGFGVSGDHGIGSSNYGSFQGLLETGGIAGSKLPFPFIVHQVSDNIGGARQNGDSIGNFWIGSYW